MNARTMKAKQFEWGEVVFNILKYVVLALFVVICIYPFYYVIIYSLSNPQLAKRGVWLWPVDFTLDTYSELFKRQELIPAFFVSVSRTVLGTIITVFCTSLAAYLATRKEFTWRKFYYRFIISSMYISSGLIPWYLTMRLYGFQNTFLLYIIPGAINAYYLLLTKTFIEQIPEPLTESALIEGAGFFSIFVKIIIPLSKPILATVAVYCAVAQWNSWQDNYFLNLDRRLTTLQLVLQDYLRNAKALQKAIESGVMMDGSDTANTSYEAIQMATVVITMIPIMLVYPFAQKFFTKGLLLGAVKG